MEIVGTIAITVVPNIVAQQKKENIYLVGFGVYRRFYLVFNMAPRPS